MTRIIALALSLFLFSISVQAEEVKIKSANLTLNADLTMAAGKKMSDGMVLMVHGTLAHKGMEIMVALRDLLAERGLSTLSINLSLAQDNRHGMYDCASPHRHSDTDAIKEIGLWVKWLKSKGAVKITALGHSRGGNQMSRFAAANSDPVVKAVVLVAPPTLSPGQPASGYKKNYKKDLAPLLVRAQSLVKAGKGGQVMEGVDFLYCPNTKVTAATFAEYYGSTPDRDTPSVIKRIKIPVLAVAGGNDRINSKFAGRMKGSTQANVKLVVIEEAGHFFRDLYGEDLADAVAEFVAAKIN
ncbi:MAG: alpha/beta hydrolase [Proteobacteria bacterium]|nr:alpha/beta hydrolase [Pseudomonadota bacterium]